LQRRRSKKRLLRHRKTVYKKRFTGKILSNIMHSESSLRQTSVHPACEYFRMILGDLFSLCFAGY
jgi:hypothetical protein